MAPRKVAKHSDTEVLDRAAEAGDVSPPKRKKTVARIMNKSDEEKQVRLPRAAKLVKNEQTEVVDPTLTAMKNIKSKNKTSSSVKSASTVMKTNSKIKTLIKKSVETEEKTDTSFENLESEKIIEKIEIKKTRTKPTAKKAGNETDEGPKGKSRGKTKKGAVNESVENFEVPITKKRKQTNAQAVLKESKSKATTTKKKTDVNVVTKSKSINNKTKVTFNNKTENNDDKIEEIVANIKTNKNDKSIKKTVAKKTRGQKNETNISDVQKIDDNSKVIEDSSYSEQVHTDDNEIQETQNNHSEVTEPVLVSKKGKNIKKKEMLSKKTTKIRGKAVDRNADAISNEEEDTIKEGKEIQKEINIEVTLSASVVKKGRGRKGTTITTVIEANGGKASENAMVDEKKILNTSEVLNGNNNIQKALEEGSDKEYNSWTLKQLEGTFEIKNEINEDNVMNALVKEGEN